GVPLILFERFEADYRGGLSAAVQPESGGELVHRVGDSSCGHPIQELDAGLVAALPVLHGECTSGELAGELEVGGAALLAETDVEYPVSGHALTGWFYELDAEADIEWVADPDNPVRWNTADVKDLRVPVCPQQGGPWVDLR